MLKGESEHHTYNINAGLDVGILYFLSQKLSLELKIAGVNYSYTTDKDVEAKNHRFNLESSLNSPNIGLKYYF